MLRSVNQGTKKFITRKITCYSFLAPFFYTEKGGDKVIECLNPTVYEIKVKPYLDVIARWKRNGFSNAQVAKNLNIDPKTLYEMAERHKELEDLLKYSLQLSITEVENALFKSAVGYFVVETTEEETDRTSKTTTKKRYIQPNVTAQMFYLRNKAGVDWKAEQLSIQQEIEKVSDLLKVLDKNTIAELSGLIKQIQKKEDEKGVVQDVECLEVSS